MGFLDMFKKRAEIPDGYYGRINRLGMMILNDEKLLARLGVYEELHSIMRELSRNSAEKSLEMIEEQTHVINGVLHQVAIPFGRAGSEKWYATVMSGWSTLHTKMLDIVHSAKSLLERGKEGRFVTESEKRELVAKVWNFFQNVYLRYALLIAGLSWYREDVSPSWSTVIPQPYPVSEKQLTTYQMPRNLDDELGGK